MLYELKKLDGYIYAYISWITVTPTELGDVVDDEGTHVNVNGIWVHPDYRKHNVLETLINYAFNHPTTQNADYVFWYREGTGKLSGIKSKERFRRFTEENNYG